MSDLGDQFLAECEIVFTPLGGADIVLVALGDLMTQLPKWSVTQDLFEATGLGSGYGFFRPLGNALVTITWIADETRNDSHAAFPTAEFAGDINLMQVTGALRIHGPARVFRYDPAILTVNPSLPIGNPPTLSRLYSVQAALPVLESTYRRPGGVDRYLRPDGSSTYLRPSS